MPCCYQWYTVHGCLRDVHKEFKKRGFTFDQLQSGLMVCRPCHSAIHRAVPDNKELAVKYRTLEDLQEVRRHGGLVAISTPYRVGIFCSI